MYVVRIMYFICVFKFTALVYSIFFIFKKSPDFLIIYPFRVLVLLVLVLLVLVLLFLRRLLTNDNLPSLDTKT